MATFPQITSPPQASAEVLVNEALETLEHQAVYGKDQSTTTALTWGYYGGRWGGFAVADGTLSLTNTIANYIVAARASGVVSVSTATTNWNNSTDYARVYKVTTAGGVVTAVEDHRGGAGGVHGSAVATGGFLAADTDGTLAANSDANVATQKATKTYVDAKVAGLSWKQAVRAGTIVAGTLATSFENGDTIDGVSLVTGDRILIKNQASGSENGIYVVAASGAPTRATDADSGAELVDASVYISEGTTLADTQWVCTTNATITVNSTALAFAQLQSASTYSFAATARIFARKTAGAGTGEEATLSEVLDFIGSAAQGDILYRGASAWTRLAAGTAKFLLQTGGASANPAWVAPRQTIAIACSDEATALTTGTAKVTFRMPYAFKLLEVRASVTLAPTGTGNLTVDINESGPTILSTKLTFDATEKTTTTAATPAVISDTDLADDAEMTVDIDAVSGTITGAGLKIYLIGYPVT